MTNLFWLIFGFSPFYYGVCVVHNKKNSRGKKSKGHGTLTAHLHRHTVKYVRFLNITLLLCSVYCCDISLFKSQSISLTSCPLMATHSVFRINGPDQLVHLQNKSCIRAQDIRPLGLQKIISSMPSQPLLVSAEAFTRHCSLCSAF